MTTETYNPYELWSCLLDKQTFLHLIGFNIDLFVGGMVYDMTGHATLFKPDLGNLYPDEIKINNVKGHSAMLPTEAKQIKLSEIPWYPVDLLSLETITKDPIRQPAQLIINDSDIDSVHNLIRSIGEFTPAQHNLNYVEVVTPNGEVIRLINSPAGSFLFATSGIFKCLDKTAFRLHEDVRDTINPIFML